MSDDLIREEDRLRALETMMTRVSGNLNALAPAVRDRIVAVEVRCDRLERLLLGALVATKNHLHAAHAVCNEDVTGAVELLRVALGGSPDE